MTNDVQFVFRNKWYRCSFLIDNTAMPCYIFVLLSDNELVSKFGNDVTIKTDFEKRLPKKDDYTELSDLRQVLFDAIKERPEFLAVRENVRKATNITEQPGSSEITCEGYRL
jgi:hypothetical protein